MPFTKRSRTMLVGTSAFACAAIATAFARRTNTRPLLGKVVVITGGSRGLGLALAHEFGRCGARLVLAARKDDELERAKDLLLKRGAVSGPEYVRLVACDLAQPDQAESLIRHATGFFGQIDVLINNAGLIHLGPVEKQPLSAYRDAMEINFFAMLETTHAVLPQMLEREDGAIVNITSIGGKLAVPHLAPYSASKFAAVGFSETLHAELKSRGVRVTTVCPGLMRTGSFPNAIVVGQQRKEYAWFSAGATAPLVSNSAERAARAIRKATEEGRTEITIGPEAYLAARVAGLAPEATQQLAHLANRMFLPDPAGTSQPTVAHRLSLTLPTLWQKLSNLLTTSHNQPSA